MGASSIDASVEVLKLCDEEFCAGPIALVWAFDGRTASHARAVIDTHRADVLDILERVLRRVPGGRAAHGSIRREILRLEQPGALLHAQAFHLTGLVRPYVCSTEPAPPAADCQPVILTLGDRKHYLCFNDIEYARSWARRVQHVMTEPPAWQAFLAERWSGQAAHFLPRIAITGRPHGFTELEACLEDALIAEAGLAQKALAAGANR